jgi:ubiquinone/menaquinone biosynthesis C-methylase UbiE
MIQPSHSIISEAFSRTAEKYDAFAVDHPNQARMRRKVFSHLTRHVSPGSHILELNCGTGIDAVELARNGYRVHATDIAPGMLDRLRTKVDELNLHERITMEQRSFLSLEDVPGGPFDAVFSDLGGLNCIADLSPVIQQLPRVLKPNGVVTWVLMSHVCLWEMAEVLRGHPRLAFRRFARGAVRSHLEGLYFDVYYFSPNEIIQKFGGDFSPLALEGLSVITPTAESKNFAKRHTRLYRSLSWLDDRLAPQWPWNGWGDFYMITFRYVPRSSAGFGSPEQ